MPYYREKDESFGTTTLRCRVIDNRSNFATRFIAVLLIPVEESPHKFDSAKPKNPSTDLDILSLDLITLLSIVDNSLTERHLPARLVVCTVLQWESLGIKEPALKFFLRWNS